MPDLTVVQDFLGLPSASQICVVVRHLPDTVRYYERILGVGPFVMPEIRYERITYHGQPADGFWKMAFASLGPIELELTQPVRPPSIYHDFLDQFGEGLHHIGFDVSDMNRFIEKAQALGIQVLMSGRTPFGGFAHLDTREAGGVIAEVIQRKSRRA